MPQLNVLSMWLTAWALWCSVAFPQSTVAPPENTGDSGSTDYSQKPARNIRSDGDA